jgi:hypothetical protein
MASQYWIDRLTQLVGGVHDGVLGYRPFRVMAALDRASGEKHWIIVLVTPDGARFFPIARLVDGPAAADQLLRSLEIPGATAICNPDFDPWKEERRCREDLS